MSYLQACVNVPQFMEVTLHDSDQKYLIETNGIDSVTTEPEKGSTIIVMKSKNRVTVKESYAMISKVLNPVKLIETK